MMPHKIFIFVTYFLYALTTIAQSKTFTTQVLVIGGTTGGIAAGIQSARSGAETIIVEQNNMLGGMLTAAGVSCTDGNYNLHSGIWEQFNQALHTHYGINNLATGWVSETCFEPHVADSIFKAWAAKESKLQVLYQWYFDKAIVENNKVVGAEFVNLKQERIIVNAIVCIDATELGDVFANAGAGYDIGTEDKWQSGENIAPGKTNIIQDITWAAILKDYGVGSEKTIAKPTDYDAAKYYCSTADAPCITGKPYSMHTRQVLDYGKLPSSDSLHPKYMLNWPAHGNDYYLDVVETKPINREQLYTKAKNHTLGFIYFLQTQLGYKNIGLADDELNNGLAWIPYNREGRRLKGLVRLNINHIKNPFQYNLYRTGIAVGDYPVDHHHGQYAGVMPKILFPKIPSFNIPLGALIPAKLHGLIVCEKGISVSNIANGTTRLQPVVLLTGQAAGILAAQCVQQKIQPRDIAVKTVQDELLKNKCYLMPYVDVTPADSAWEAIQKVGIAGILKGKGISEGWANKTFFYPDSNITIRELEANVAAIFLNDKEKRFTSNEKVNTTNLVQLINKIYHYQSKHYSNKAKAAFAMPPLNKNDFARLNLGGWSEHKILSRREIAVILNDRISWPEVRIDGTFIQPQFSTNVGKVKSTVKDVLAK